MYKVWQVLMYHIYSPMYLLDIGIIENSTITQLSACHMSFSSKKSISTYYTPLVVVEHFEMAYVRYGATDQPE